MSDQFATAIFLVGDDVITRLKACDLEALNEEVSKLVEPLFDMWKRRGRALALLPALSSLNQALRQLHGRGSLVLARTLGLEATLLLAVAAPAPRNGALSAAQAAVKEASLCLEGTDRDAARRFIAEQELVSAVALKAAGDVQAAVQHCLEATKFLGNRALAVPLLRQWALIEQDEVLFNQVVKISVEEPGVDAKEEFRSLKRALEYQLNRRNLAQAEKLMQPTLSAFSRAANELDHISRVSLIKNLGQFIALQGEGDRALRILTLAGVLAGSAGFNGQTRQVNQLIADVRDGKDVQLETFRI